MPYRTPSKPSTSLALRTEKKFSVLGAIKTFRKQLCCRHEWTYGQLMDRGGIGFPEEILRAHCHKCDKETKKSVPFGGREMRRLLEDVRIQETEMDARVKERLKLRKVRVRVKPELIHFNGGPTLTAEEFDELVCEMRSKYHGL